MTIRRMIIVAMVLLLLAGAFGPLVIQDGYLVERYLPSPLNIAIFAACVLLVFVMKDPLLQIICAGWSCWFLVGNLFIIGSYFRRRLLAPLFVQDANTLFLVAIACFAVGAIVGERVSGRPALSQRNQLPPDRPAGLSLFALAMFPLAYAAALLIWRIPTITSGENIVDLMYEVDKGPIYAIRSVLALSILAVATRIDGHLARSRKLMLMGVVLAVLVLSILDGKRDVALVSLVAIGAHLLLAQGARISVRQIASVVIVGVAYALIADLRSNRTAADEAPILYVLTALGVEYKDFVHSINYLSIEQMQALGYDWVRSSVASVLNRNILQIFGVDKDIWVQMDSARAWMRAYGITLGIRTGIVSELYYAFGLGLFPAMTLSGWLFSRLVRALRRSRQGSYWYIYLLAVYGNFGLAITTQTTALLGSAVTLTYALVTLLFLDWMTKRRSAVRHGKALT